MASSRRTCLLLLAVGVAWTPLCSRARAQAKPTTATVRTAENFRKDPNGQVLAHLQAGTSLSVVGRQDGWLEVVVEGWVWSRSLQVAKREGLDLIVSASGGENLRSEPGGSVLGHLEEGTLLAEVERKPGWIHVRRQGWLWAASATEGGSAPSSGATAAGATSASSAPPPSTAAGQTNPPGQAAVRPGGLSTTGSGGAAILSSPGGDTVGRAAAGTELEVVSRQGSWARVRLEGWTWLPAPDTANPASDSVRVLTPADLTRQPQDFRGRMVSWQLQFISLEHADKVRTDFFEGEPFLLTRFGSSAGPFVYVAVPQGRVQEMSGLVPLERIKVTGRVRTGASALTGTPIIDLVTLERIGKVP